LGELGLCFEHVGFDHEPILARPVS
jgi:hypothetical protein